MKKIRRLFFGFAALALAAVFTLAGCGDNGNPSSPPGDTCTVRFDRGEGTGTAPSSQLVESGTNITLPGIGSMTAPSGKTFNGWSAGGQNYAANADYTVTGNVTFTAQWSTPGDTVDDLNIPTAAVNVAMTNIDWAMISNLSSSTLNNFRYNIITRILSDSVKQGGTLKSGYTAVKGAYPNIPGIQNIITAETGIANVSNWSGIANGAPTQYSDAIVNAIFTNDATAKAAFNKELTAYKKGAYFDEKQRFSGDVIVGDNCNEPSRRTLIDEFKAALTAAGVTTQVAEANQGISPIITNMPAILTELRTKMLTKINAAMGVDQIANTTNKAAIQSLNGNLLTQIAEDFAQIKALVDDIKDLNPIAFDDWEEIMYGYEGNNYPLTAMGAQKASSFESDRFLPQFSKGKDSETALG